METKSCQFFNSKNGCFKGKDCKFAHIENKPKIEVSKNTETPQKKVCNFFGTEKGCLKGSECPFLHTTDSVKKETKMEASLLKAPCPIVDIGINLTNSRFSKDLKQIIKKSVECNVTHLIITGVSEESSKKGLEMTEKSFDGVKLFFTSGVHPHDAKTCNEGSIEILTILAQHKNCVAIGECGLDFDRSFSKKEVQEFWFEEQLKLAEKVKKPVFLHERSAFDSFSKILSKYKVKACVHCFTGTEKELDYYLKKGYYIGITGFICKKERGKDLRKMLKKIPLERLMIETGSKLESKDKRWTLHVTS
jgi:TatD DNase family protein